MADVLTREQILTEVQKLTAKLYKTPVAERCANTANFILHALDYALSTGTEEELAAIVQPWLHNKLFGVVQDVKQEMLNNGKGENA